MKEMEYKNEKIFKILSHGEYKDIPYWAISFGTHPCAYIEVTKYKNFLGEGTQESHRCDDIKIDCHGGVTYDEDYLNDVWDEAFDDFKPNARRFIGWDYAHARDYYEYHSQAMSMSLNSFENAHKWTTEEIVKEVKEVIDSLIASVAGTKKLETKSLTIDEDEMTVEEIRNHAQFALDFDEKIRERANKLYKAEHSWQKYPSHFDHVEWNETCTDWDEKLQKRIPTKLWLRYYWRDDRESEIFPIEYFADGFDIDAHVKRKIEEYEAQQKLEEENKKLAAEQKERRQYEKLKAKFEGENK